MYVGRCATRNSLYCDMLQYVVCVLCLQIYILFVPILSVVWHWCDDMRGYLGDYVCALV